MSRSSGSEIHSLHSVTSRPASYGSSRFRQSTHLIPTPDVDARPPRHEPTYTRPWAFTLVFLICLGLAIGLEVGVSISKKNNGFTVPPTNALSFVSAQFLLSFTPALLILPLGYLIRCMDWSLRWAHPYVLLSKGNATPAETILLDYIALGVRVSLMTSLRYKHFIVFFSALASAATFFLQSLSGGIFTLISVQHSTPANTTSIRTVGLVNDTGTLAAFVAAAGYADAAVFQNLADPPFVSSSMQGGWAVAEFQLPSQVPLNASMAANTTAVLSSTNCVNPSLPPSLVNSAPNVTTLTSASSVNPCNVSVTYDPSSVDEQYGAIDVACANSTNEVQFRPVMFWFVHKRDDGKPEASTVFCSPTISPYHIIANISLSDKSVHNISPGSNYTALPLVDPPLLGRAFNGVVFEPSTDPFIQARATTVKTGIPGTIFRLAEQTGLQDAFDNQEGFLGPTEKVYSQHLAIIAKSIYFVPDTKLLLYSQLGYLRPRLWINPFAAHALSILLVIISGVTFITQIMHWRARKDLYLTCPPGTVAAVVALTSRSGFGDLLLPYDDEATIKRKMKNLRFRLDERTGAILADDYYPPGTPGLPDDDLGFNDETDASTSLLHPTTSPLRKMSFSQAQNALQAAVGYPPKNEYKYVTPYDK